MPEIWFYHLEQTPLEQALPDLLEKVAARGWKAYVHGLEDDKIQALDQHLWTYTPASFLAHGREGDELAAQQPVLLGTSGPDGQCARRLSVGPRRQVYRILTVCSVV
ncbi:MAG: DNA polymerase III subunit chi [Asticcacaulis sp.]